jgi:antigen 43
MSDSGSFFWIGTTSEDWNTPANWADVTMGEAPASVVPGSLDIVTINDGTLTGSGDVASLTFLNTDTVLGDLKTGTLMVGRADSVPAILDIDAGATVSTATAVDTGTILVSGSAAALLVSELLSVGPASSAGILSATNGAHIQTDDLAFGSDLANQVVVDGSSTIEIGNAGAVATGALTIDPGKGLSGSASIIGSLVDNGLMSSSYLILGQPFVFAGGHGSSSFEGSEFTSSLSGTGTIEVEAGGIATLQEPVTTPGLEFQLDGTATLDIEASISAGNTIDLSGNSNTLAINDQWYLEEHPAQSVGQSPFFTGRPPAVDATIDGFGASDALIFVDNPLLDTTITAAAYGGGALTLFNGTTVVSSFNLAGDYDGETFSVGAPTNSQQTITVACFAAGTGILTPNGERAVEDLHEGDSVIVLRADGQSNEKVKWIGHQYVDLVSHPRPGLAAPIRLRRDAMAPARPHRDLLVSPDHCLLVEGKLIPALMLVNDMTIVQERDQRKVHYFHIELERHGILLAEGLAVESYLDTGNRATFANAGVAVLLHPEFQVNEALRTWRDDACAPLTVDPATLEPIWRLLAGRAEQLGFRPRQITTTTEPRLHAVVAGRVISPTARSADRYTFILPGGTKQVILSSWATRPSDIVRYLDDRRLLGVAVCNVTLCVGQDVIVFPADHLPVGSGWHAHERTIGALWRWTDGAGELLFDPLPEAAIMELRLSGSACYIVEPPPTYVAGRGSSLGIGALAAGRQDAPKLPAAIG